MSFLRKIKDKFYDYFVRKIPQIRIEYENFVNENKAKHKKNRLSSWNYLIKLNIVYRVFKFKGISNDVQTHFAFCGDSENKIDSESSLSFLKKPEEFANDLLEYDVISFDIFDTLIFRPFSRPADLFFLLAEKHNYLDFARIRKEMEQKTRQEKFKKMQTYEITLDEIYETIQKYVGIEKQSAMQLEIETELEMCFANPYMHEVFEILKKKNKKIIIVSDMYLGKDVLDKMIEKCGYKGYTKLFVSCEYHKSKYHGELYGIVKNKVGENLKYVHIGDNEKSDIEQAKKNGFMAIKFDNVNDKGYPYRTLNMSEIIGGAYSGIVNAKLHNGLNKFSPQYEYGYVYGGIFVLGYCNFIHKYSIENGVDKVLFLARDGDILKRVYDELYPDNNSEYVYWSRLVATKLLADEYRYDFFKRFIFHKIDANVTIEKIFSVMELQELLSRFSIDKTHLLNEKNADVLVEFLLDNWQDVLKIYSKQEKPAKIYYQKILKNCKKVCAIDVGWSGSGANVLSHLFEKWNIDCEMVSIVAGTNTKNNFEKDVSEAQLQSGKMVSYIYSQSHNRNLWNLHNPSLGHNVFFEMLLSSTELSFKGFCFDENKNVSFQFVQSEQENEKTILEIQNGIVNFISDYTTRFAKYDYMMNISGSDAYAPFQLAIANDAKYLKKIMGECTFNVYVGEDNVTRKVRDLV